MLDGRYELVERIGAGGFGQVWEAYDPKVDRWVAVKVLAADGSPDSSRQVARFAREAAVAGGLFHPSIVTVHDFGSTVHDGRQVAYLVMELIDGDPLSAALKDGPLGRAETLDIAYRVADALAAAHDADLVHRDIKPANAALLLAYIADRGNMNTATDQASRWLFPGRRAGQPAPTTCPHSWARSASRSPPPAAPPSNSNSSNCPPPSSRTPSATTTRPPAASSEKAAGPGAGTPQATTYGYHPAGLPLQSPTVEAQITSRVGCG
ncbi:protein kinase [Kitasatospora sp. NPDC051705]|uniref:protein kinase domain-containing protein n=1 Tax=Kitasatospora sp. NPDC051705 TaxID=3364057 RepID=UPI0037AED86E